MKVEIQCKYKVTITDDESVTQSNSSNDAEPTLYPGLKDLENPTSADIVDHVLNNRPKLQWVLEKADKQAPSLATSED